MSDIDAKYCRSDDKNLHAVTGQAMYDVAHAGQKTHEARLSTLRRKRGMLPGLPPQGR